jgi:hypothetical protein
MIGEFMIQRRSLNFIFLCFLQTPVFKGKEENQFEGVKQLVLQIVSSEAFAIAVFAISIAIGLYILYNRKKAIPELEIQLIKDDTWFATRDERNRTGIIVSLEIKNKATYGIYFKNCKLSGYSPKDSAEPICLEDLKGANKQNLNFPQYKQFCRGQEFYIRPYSSDKMWVYFESRSVMMANLLETSLSIIDSRKKRKSIRIAIPRHKDQIAIYQQMAQTW